MDIKIREAVEKDYPQIQKVVEAAFKNVEMSDHTEHELIMKIKQSEAHIPELSIVALEDDKIVGHLMMSKINIIDGDKQHLSLALAPVAVAPDEQMKGVGSSLINQSIKIAAALGYESVIVLGHHTYYPKFGFQKASDYHIYPPFDVPDEYFMVLPLKEDGLKDTKGIVKYSSAFG